MKKPGSCLRHERLYLNDIVEAADYIAEFIAGADFQAFQASELLRSAVMQKLGVIGEAAARVSADLTSRHPEVPWPRLVAFRNILIHAYFGIDWDVVWRAVEYVREEESQLSPGAQALRQNLQDAVELQPNAAA